MTKSSIDFATSLSVSFINWSNIVALPPAMINTQTDTSDSFISQPYLLPLKKCKHSLYTQHISPQNLARQDNTNRPLSYRSLNYSSFAMFRCGGLGVRPPIFFSKTGLCHSKHPESNVNRPRNH